jgi:hypothetical protein
MKYFSALLILTVVTVFGVLLGDFLKIEDDLRMPQSEKSIAAAENAGKTCLSQGVKKFRSRHDCYADYYYNLTFKNNKEFAFTSMLELQKMDESAKECHFILHSIGRAAFDKDPDNWKQTLSDMPVECDYGGLHGVLEAYQAAGGEVSKKTIPTFCTDDYEGGCAHAVGHLLLVEQGNKLDEANVLCKSYTEEEERHNCMAGVFMERMIPRNLVSHGLVEPGKVERWWDNIAEHEELCRSFSGEEFIACWTEISHSAAYKFRGEWEAVFAFCNSTDLQKAAGSCMRHVIIDLVGINNFDLSRLKPMCTSASSTDHAFEGDCYNELAKSAIIGLHPDLLPNVSDFCESLSLPYQNSCLEISAETISSRSMDREEKEKVCLALPSRYFDSCIKKSGNKNKYKEII